MHNKTIAELAMSLASGEFSGEELTNHYLNRIDKLGDQLNCYVTVISDLALQQARDADKARANGNAHALAGVPLLHKDIFCTNDVKTSYDSKMLDNFIAPYDATVVTKCKQANMVTLGKANMDEFAMGSSNETSFYGPVKNP